MLIIHILKNFLAYNEDTNSPIKRFAFLMIYLNFIMIYNENSNISNIGLYQMINNIFLINI